MGFQVIHEGRFTWGSCGTLEYSDTCYRMSNSECVFKVFNEIYFYGILLNLQVQELILIIWAAQREHFVIWDCDTKVQGRHILQSIVLWVHDLSFLYYYYIINIIIILYFNLISESKFPFQQANGLLRLCTSSPSPQCIKLFVSWDKILTGDRDEEDLEWPSDLQLWSMKSPVENPPSLTPLPLGQGHSFLLTSVWCTIEPISFGVFQQNSQEVVYRPKLFQDPGFLFFISFSNLREINF